MSKPNWINTSPNSGNGNGSIQVTAQANESDARQGSVVVTGGGLSKTININQNSAMLDIGTLNYNGCNHGLYTVANIETIGIKGTAYCVMTDGGYLEKEFDDVINIPESEHYTYVYLEGRSIINSVKSLIINMETTLDFIGNPNNLCELFTTIAFNSTKRNTKLDISFLYENLVYIINDALISRYPDNHMVINFSIVDFDEADKERIRSMVTCDRFVVAF